MSMGPVLIPSDEAAAFTEASPLATFETAAGCLAGERDVPDDVWRVYRGDVLYFRSLAHDGRVLRSWSRARIPA